MFSFIVHFSQQSLLRGIHIEQFSMNEEHQEMFKDIGVFRQPFVLF